MKKRFFFPLLLLILTGCGAPAPEEPEVLPEVPPAEASFTLPETRPLKPISAPAIVTEGRAPAENYKLPPSQEHPDYWGNMQKWAYEGMFSLLAEVPEEDAAFYGLPWEEEGVEKVLIRWGDCLAEFDWIFSPGPNIVLPWIDCIDIDGDQEDELVVICHVGGGTGVSLDELHILEKSLDGALTVYTFPESLWREQLPGLFDMAQVNGRTFAVLGHELVEIDGEGLDLEAAPSSGLIANFSLDGESLSFWGAFALCREDSSIPHYVAETSAKVRYGGGVFTLQDIHLYSDEQ